MLEGGRSVDPGSILLWAQDRRYVDRSILDLIDEPFWSIRRSGSIFDRSLMDDPWSILMNLLMVNTNKLPSYVHYY